MTDAPERTLSERIQDRQTTFRDAGDVEDLRGYIVDDSQLRDIAALEQERRDLLERLGIAWARSKTENEELARLRKAIRERDEWLDQIRSCLFQPGPLLAHTTLLIAQGIVRAAIDARATAEGKNDGNDGPA
jgi:hypothetical protein